MDYFAIATQGFFPEPTPTDEERMAFAATWGHLSVVPEAVSDTYGFGFLHLGLDLSLN